MIGAAYAADLDMDGDLDILGAAPDLSTIFWWESDLDPYVPDPFMLISPENESEVDTLPFNFQWETAIDIEPVEVTWEPEEDLKQIINPEIPDEYGISAIYPNPFNSRIVMIIGLPQHADLEVYIYNILGELVTILADESFAKGFHTLTYDATGYPTGITSSMPECRVRWMKSGKLCW